jgi:hypothetical protein
MDQIASRRIETKVPLTPWVGRANYLFRDRENGPRSCGIVAQKDPSIGGGIQSPFPRDNSQARTSLGLSGQDLSPILGSNRKDPFEEGEIRRLDYILPSAFCRTSFLKRSSHSAKGSTSSESAWSESRFRSPGLCPKDPLSRWIRSQVLRKILPEA